jgi:cell shape-determining protein MreC
MTTSDDQDWRRRLASRPALVAVALGAALLLAVAPERATDPARHGWQALLSPAQRVMGRIVDTSRDFCEHWQAASADREQLADTIDTAKRLTEDNRRLRQALTTAQVDVDNNLDGSNRTSTTGGALAPLLTLDAITARVLGRTAQSVLQGRAVLDVGSRSRVTPGALVVDGENFSGAAVIDAGRDANLAPDRLAIVGRSVWGKLGSVGPMTSVVRRLTDPGYRDLVEIAHRDGGRLRVSARGVVVGNGEKLCRIEMVDATAPVAVDDEAYTLTDGVESSPLLYGHIVRAEHLAGQPHWQLWLAPAIGDRDPRVVAVLRMDLNPARMAAVDKPRE